MIRDERLEIRDEKPVGSMQSVSSSQQSAVGRGGDPRKDQR